MGNRNPERIIHNIINNYIIMNHNYITTNNSYNNIIFTPCIYPNIEDCETIRSNLSFEIVKFEDLPEDVDECPISMEKFNNESIICKTKCNHYFEEKI